MTLPSELGRGQCFSAGVSAHRMGTVIVRGYQRCTVIQVVWVIRDQCYYIRLYES